MLRSTRRYLCNTPGWQTRQKTRDTRTREKREEERKIRQLEKLPKPELLYAPQYGLEKKVLADSWFQPTVYDNEFDTPHLFHRKEHLSPEFFLRFDCKSFSTTCYPDLPPIDYRRLDTASWLQCPEKSLCVEYLEKHGIIPDMLRHVSNDINVSINGQGPFWHTPHYGNFIELKDLQRIPTISLPKDGHLYTLFVVCPDYPYRAKPEEGFFLHYVVCNLTGQGPETAASGGIDVVPYVPPLPTEDAGAFRVLYLVYRQEDKGGGTSTDVSGVNITFPQRRRFFLHEPNGMLNAVEKNLSDDPVAVRMCHTVWDIQTAEWYETQGLEEPSYIPEDTLAELLNYARPRFSRYSHSRIHPYKGGINEKGTGQQYHWPMIGHFTVPYLSRRVRAPLQGRPLPNPFRGAY